MKSSVKSDPSRERRFRALIRGEFRPEFNREVAIAVRRALREARRKQGALPVRTAAEGIPTAGRPVPPSGMESARPGIEGAMLSGANGAMLSGMDGVRPGMDGARPSGMEGAVPSDIQTDERRAIHNALVRAQYKVWLAQEAEAKRRYPNLSLEQELKNPDFVRLLTDPKRPMTVCRAYEAVHLDDIQTDIAREAAVRTAVRMAALSRRPRESGAAPQAGLPMHYGAADPKSRAEIARRALRGERITL